MKKCLWCLAGMMVVLLLLLPELMLQLGISEVETSHNGTGALLPVFSYEGVAYSYGGKVGLERMKRRMSYPLEPSDAMALESTREYIESGEFDRWLRAETSNQSESLVYRLQCRYLLCGARVFMINETLVSGERGGQCGFVIASFSL
ncbi:hypothetical protein [Rubritalea squalenifaciens]|nr:hypothetical protein [Rubritalea squalenifaciens]